MTPATLLLRQVHPNWVKGDGSIASLAFYPSQKDAGLLSVDDGDRATAEKAWQHYTAQLGFASAGVWAATLQEVSDLTLPVRADPVQGNATHAVIDFTAHSDKQRKALAKVLAASANTRGCQFRA